MGKSGCSEEKNYHVFELASLIVYAFKEQSSKCRLFNMKWQDAPVIFLPKSLVVVVVVVVVYSGKQQDLALV